VGYSKLLSTYLSTILVGPDANRYTPSTSTNWPRLLSWALVRLVLLTVNYRQVLSVNHPIQWLVSLLITSFLTGTKTFSDHTLRHSTSIILTKRVLTANYRILPPSSSSYHLFFFLSLAIAHHPPRAPSFPTPVLSLIGRLRISILLGSSATTRPPAHHLPSGGFLSSTLYTHSPIGDHSLAPRGLNFAPN
jgi:hypothetical protein